MIRSSENINYICLRTDRYGVATYRQGDAYTPSVLSLCKRNLNVSNMGKKELWKPVVGYEGLYEVSNYGNIRSLDRIVVYSDGRTHKYNSCIIKQTENKGYLYVGLNKNNKKSSEKVHRLVAKSFIDNPGNKPCIDHINGNKADNKVTNLRWVTYKENMRNPLTKEKMSNIRSNGLSDKIIQSKKDKGIIKKVYQFSLDGKLLNTYESISDANRATNILASSICECCQGKSGYSHAGGFIWSYTPQTNPYVNPNLKRYRKIDMYDNNYHYIKTFANIIDASKELGIRKKGITKCCSKKSKTYKGHIFRYHKEEV